MSIADILTTVLMYGAVFGAGVAFGWMIARAGSQVYLTMAEDALNRLREISDGKDS